MDYSVCCHGELTINKLSDRNTVLGLVDGCRWGRKISFVVEHGTKRLDGLGDASGSHGYFQR